MIKRIFSFVLVFALVLTTLIGSASAAAGDSSGTFADFNSFSVNSNGYISLYSPRDAISSYGFAQGFFGYSVSVVYYLPYNVTSGSVSVSSVNSSFDYLGLSFYDSDLNSLPDSYALEEFPFTFTVPASARYLHFIFYAPSKGAYAINSSSISYSDFVYEFETDDSAGLSASAIAVAERLLTSSYTMPTWDFVDDGIVSTSTSANDFYTSYVSKVASDYVFQTYVKNTLSSLSEDGNADVSDILSIMKTNQETSMGALGEIWADTSSISDDFNSILTNSGVGFTYPFVAVYNSTSERVTFSNGPFSHSSLPSFLNAWATSQSNVLRGIYSAVSRSVDFLSDIYTSITNLVTPAQQALQDTNEETIESVVSNDLVVPSASVDSLSEVKDFVSDFLSTPVSVTQFFAYLNPDGSGGVSWFGFFSQECADSFLPSDDYTALSPSSNRARSFGAINETELFGDSSDDSQVIEDLYSSNMEYIRRDLGLPMD